MCECVSVCVSACVSVCVQAIAFIRGKSTGVV